MADLRDRLLAAVERRERLASEATPGPWAKVTDESPEFAVVVQDARGTWALGSGFYSYDAAHVAANDPAMVLRACTAHRRIVARYDEAVATAQRVASRPPDGPAWHVVAAAAESRVAVLADVLHELADAYGVTSGG